MEAERENELPTGFHFVVDLVVSPEGETETFSLDDPDAKFQSVSGLNVDIETEEFAEGGVNQFKHKLPVRTKFPNLVLKRAIMPSSKLIKWCKSAIEDFEFTPRDLNIMLLNQEGTAIYTWRVARAFPVKWNVDAFNAEESKIVIETLELSYNYFTTDTTKHEEPNAN